MARLRGLAGPAPGSRAAPGGGDRDVDCLSDTGGLGHDLAVLAHAVDVEGDGLADVPADLCQGLAGGHAPWEIGDVRRVVPLPEFDDDGVSLHGRSSRPDCLRILLKVDL